MSDKDDTKALRELITDDVEDGDFQVRKIQKLGRVDVPDKFWDHVGLDIGQEIIVVVEDDAVKLMDKDLSNIDGGI